MDERMFFNRFADLLENYKNKYSLEDNHDAFIIWFGETCLGCEPRETSERIIRDYRAEGVDALLLDRNNNEYFFIAAKTVKDYEYTKRNFRETDIKSTLQGLRLLLRGDYKGKITTELENLVKEYHEDNRLEHYKTSLLFLTLKAEPIDFKFVKEFNNDFPKVEVRFFSFENIFKIYSDIYLKARAKPPESITFEALSPILPKENPVKSIVFTCSGKDLAKLFNDHGEALFGHNVRYFLGLRSRSINEKIVETASDKVWDKFFWYFNNGINIICEKIDISGANDIIRLRNAQVINGAQTTYALGETLQQGTLSDTVQLLVKVTETNDYDLAEKITYYTNNQNAIKSRDLCSNDAIQTQIQRIIRDSFGYFYEIKRGEFEARYPTPVEKEGLLGLRYKKMIIDNEEAAQSYLALYLGKPAEAKSEKNRIFSKESDGFYKTIFNENVEYLAEKIFFSWRLLKYIEEKKRLFRKEYRKAVKNNISRRSLAFQNDFILHSELFVLNLIVDFYERGDVSFNDVANIKEFVRKIDSTSGILRKAYDSTIKALRYCIKEYKNAPDYYHNKFFKNNNSLGIIRRCLKKEYDFIKVECAYPVPEDPPQPPIKPIETPSPPSP